MHPAILEDIEHFRKKLEAAEGELTEGLQSEYAILSAKLDATIEAQHQFAQEIEKMRKSISRRTNELLVFGSLLKGKTK